MDSSGILYAQADPALRSPTGEVQIADSAAIVRWRSPCIRDTVAYVPNPFGDEAMVFRNSTVMRRMGGSPPPPFKASVQWAVSRDGRVAIIAPDPYHVNFVDASGRRHKGPRISVPALPLTEEHKAEWRAKQSLPAPGLLIVRAEPGASRQMMSRDVVEPKSWPDQLPPFLDDAVAFDMEGMLWVRRTTAARAPATYDVIDSLGNRVQSVVLPPDRRVVGFGDSTVLVASTDEDGIERLEMYRNPATGN